MNSTYSKKEAATLSGTYYNNSLSLLRNLAVSSVEMSDLAKFNLKNLLFGNLPKPMQFEWESQN